LFHLVDDRFLVAQILYLLDPSSATRFFIFLMADWGQEASGKHGPTGHGISFRISLKLKVEKTIE